MRRVGTRRRGTRALWLKRNWLLMLLAVLAVVGVFLSVALLFEPCDEKSESPAREPSAGFVFLRGALCLLRRACAQRARSGTSKLRRTFERPIPVAGTAAKASIGDPEKP